MSTAPSGTSAGVGTIALQLRDVYAGYGPVRALHGVSIDVHKGQIVTLLGANGAGKSTTLRVISGMLEPTSGSVELLGESVLGKRPNQLVHHGLMHAPEGRKIFGAFSVLENLKIGAYTRGRSAGIQTSVDEIFDYFPILGTRRKQEAATLSGGEQQMLAIGRALMSNPELLLLDEPSLGLAPLIVRDIYRILKRINERGTTMLLVEQNASIALDVADYAYVLATGSIVVEGSPEAMRGNEDVRRSYLGY